MVAETVWSPKGKVQRVDAALIFFPLTDSVHKTGKDQRIKGLILSVPHTGRRQQELLTGRREKEAE